MSWLTWRAHRGTLLIGTAFLVGLGMMYGGLAAVLRILYPDGDIGVCALVPAHDAPSQCSGSGFAQLVNSTAADVFSASELLGPIIPLVIGSFLAASITAQEFRSGTARWAITQGISRDRWLVGLVSTVLAFAAAGLVVFETGYLLWRSVLGLDVAGPIGPMTFGLGPVEMGAKVLLAIGIGLLMGTAVRSPAPAVALSSTAWIAAMTLIEQLGPYRSVFIVQIGVLTALSVLVFLGVRGLVARRTV
ncbi:hypothetical protein [Actinoalloteichus hymeniacidonis]|uniref:Uncharacterized protein n=1 Tax=Actinoalloteichus hymeniacidonis TaxID=340345 RepID=A0AAC9HTQ0_9PSEU|nr:hypothetical protein [Actinoalloteichus hymeniacidonis]AOS65298.1 hypothetical protein TL08_22580 [Actinoalloteichus hymeniacidonis]MBB5906617.1 ABC-type transport system involved in multi-copper enzyme maturation permease subunit [Actinoalloteichus hymeniacidonis]